MTPHAYRRSCWQIVTYGAIAAVIIALLSGCNILSEIPDQYRTDIEQSSYYISKAQHYEKRYNEWKQAGDTNDVLQVFRGIELIAKCNKNWKKAGEIIHASIQREIDKMTDSAMKREAQIRFNKLRNNF